MTRWLGEWCDYMLNSWSEASMSDFAVLALAIVVVGWVVKQCTQK